ncbi:hypothetical protein SKAU_G00201320 [Synaphobranchus kaupii]|uniref:Uncharacterized protein n=1 Tax=Synaphobranchus kaupii TaxID=118154 RepID=A0A9Q1IY82_SYNKA|nr:hypothetical protein SKAU_G00201320 [Synaphobranchus kaupii]
MPAFSGMAEQFLPAALSSGRHFCSLFCGGSREVIPLEWRRLSNGAPPRRLQSVATSVAVRPQALLRAPRALFCAQFRFLLLPSAAIAGRLPPVLPRSRPRSFCQPVSETCNPTATAHLAPPWRSLEDEDEGEAGAAEPLALSSPGMWLCRCRP